MDINGMMQGTTNCLGRRLQKSTQRRRTAFEMMQILQQVQTWLVTVSRQNKRVGSLYAADAANFLELDHVMESLAKVALTVPDKRRGVLFSIHDLFAASIATVIMPQPLS